MDNLPVHHVSGARGSEAVSEGCVLPPYSDLSPIELCWSKLSNCCASAKARTREALDQA